MSARFLVRVRVLAGLIVGLALVIVGRLYVLQILNGDAYAARADNQFILPQTPLPLRDSIYFTYKSGMPFTAATLKDGFSLAVNPTKITDAESVYKKLSGLLTISRDTFLAKATKANTQYQLIANHLESSLGLQIQALGVPGLTVSADRWRYYPGDSLAAHTLGFVAYNGSVQEGRYGLERYYQDTLAKTEDLYSNFFVELFSGAKNMFKGEHQTGDLVTTLEPATEEELERDLATYMTKWHPKLAGGIIMDPQTGEIVAMAVTPTFNLNSFGAESDAAIYSNPLVQNVYEMGSIMKPLTMAAGLDSGAVKPSSTYNDIGCMTVDQKKICNFDLKARGVVPMQEVLSQSLNLGASYIATKMGPATMRDYFLNHYGLGEKTGIDLPIEVAGLTNNIEKSPRLVEYDTASFGQGIAVTPIEMVRALATLANGGKLVTPHLVTSIKYDTGITKDVTWPAPKQVLKPETSTEVSRMLTTVVDTALAHGAIKMEHYSVAAKTGTAQIANPAGGGYYPDKYLHSYFGYLPSFNAKFVIFLFAYEPQGASFASETWTDIFHSLTQFLINYYAIPPDR